MITGTVSTPRFTGKTADGPFMRTVAFFQEIDVYRNCSFELLKISSVALAEIISTVACDAEPL